MFKDLRFAILKLLDYTEGMQREANDKMIGAQMMLYKIDNGLADDCCSDYVRADIEESEMILKLAEGVLEEIKIITKKADELEEKYNL